MLSSFAFPASPPFLFPFCHCAPNVTLVSEDDQSHCDPNVSLVSEDDQGHCDPNVTLVSEDDQDLSCLPSFIVTIDS